MSNPLRDVARAAMAAATQAHRAKHGPGIPSPDVPNVEMLPFGVPPGENKFGLQTRPTCGKHASDTRENDCPKAFLFRDKLSAREYTISGMCQTCQDGVFGKGEAVLDLITKKEK